MPQPLEQIINAYRRDVPLAQAHTIPSAWYTEPRVFDLERRTVFTRSWQVAGRIEELRAHGDYVACELSRAFRTAAPSAMSPVTNRTRAR